MTAAYRPVPGKYTVDASRQAIVKIVRYSPDGLDATVRACGSYRATYPIPVSCLRPLTEPERIELSDMVAIGFAD